jgi:hypothetical protein
VCGGFIQQSQLITSIIPHMVKCAGCSIIFGPGRGDNCSSGNFLNISMFFFVAYMKCLYSLLWVIGV